MPKVNTLFPGRPNYAPLDMEVLVYIKKHIPDCAWDGKTLVVK